MTRVAGTLSYLPPRLAWPGLYPTSHHDSHCRDSSLPPTITHTAGTLSYLPPWLTLPEQSRRPSSYPYPHGLEHNIAVVVTSTNQSQKRFNQPWTALLWGEFDIDPVGGGDKGKTKTCRDNILELRPHWTGTIFSMLFVVAITRTGEHMDKGVSLDLSGTPVTLFLSLHTKSHTWTSMSTESEVRKEMVDYIADYLETIRQRRVYPDVQPGYLRTLVPEHAPQESEPWERIMADMETFIMPGIAHWQSPHMHGYSAINSFPSLLGDMLANAINCLGFSWSTCPAATELEVVVTNWLGKMIGLPAQFLNTGADTKGGGVLQNTSSEATLVSLLSSRTEAIRRQRAISHELDEDEINKRLVAYCSDQAHSSVVKGCQISRIRLHVVESDDNFCLRSQQLDEVIAKDKKEGLIPFYEGIWLHVDAAYAGTAFICPEFRSWLDGIHYVDSFVFLPCKIMMHWQISLSKHFQSLKLWFVIRNYGIDGLQKHIRKNVHLAERFERLVRSDEQFEVPVPRHLGMVVFRLRGHNTLTETFLKTLNSRGHTYCATSRFRGVSAVRYVFVNNNNSYIFF
uniref:Histidine decarboxylase n=1 Tax=Timema monikensis TaxID=170555 RepID=A0A7R9HJA7_9NEOP|nr:unnamed protein product [Timema monikensis]